MFFFSANEGDHATPQKGILVLCVLTLFYYVLLFIYIYKSSGYKVVRCRRMIEGSK